MKIFSLQVLRARPTSTQQRAALMQLEDGELDKIDIISWMMALLKEVSTATLYTFERSFLILDK